MHAAFGDWVSGKSWSSQAFVQNGRYLHCSHRSTRVWVRSPGGPVHRDPQHLADQTSGHHAKEAQHLLPHDVFRQASRLQLLPARPPKHARAHPVLLEFVAAVFPAPSSCSRRSWSGLAHWSRHLLLGVLHGQPQEAHARIHHDHCSSVSAVWHPGIIGCHVCWLVVEGVVIFVPYSTVWLKKGCLTGSKTSRGRGSEGGHWWERAREWDEEVVTWRGLLFGLTQSVFGGVHRDNFSIALITVLSNFFCTDALIPMQYNNTYTFPPSKVALNGMARGAITALHRGNLLLEMAGSSLMIHFQYSGKFMFIVQRHPQQCRHELLEYNKVFLYSPSGYWQRVNEAEEATLNELFISNPSTVWVRERTQHDDAFQGVKRPS